MTTRKLDGNAVRDLRKALGLSQGQLCQVVAKRAGRPLSVPHLCNIEKGHKDPSPGLAQAIADALGVSIATISNPTPISRVVIVEITKDAA